MLIDEKEKYLSRDLLILKNPRILCLPGYTEQQLREEEVCANRNGMIEGNI